ncbi:hypothetical protein NFHSH190041_22370 [Shewanella sp. NFH-SH190041]|uniref:DUF2897 family protein n=1 Tax=Shewanella sp. NFH-SH190041 TaxID=2950245 RepID=UPI0021C4704D|nr:DUF2897 family protein [Shewanella sp. NFH-SH190041]BDM64785.1 hypothetical protein NFHSH190041_22370 [Shewanella sp. NFH-SH190041]
MSDLEAILIILLVIGVVASNLAVLKHTAKFKLPQFGRPKTPDNQSDKPASQQTTEHQAQGHNVQKVDGNNKADLDKAAPHTDKSQDNSQ